MVPAATTGPEPNAPRDLQWVDEVAALLPEDSRLGWYQNVRPWLRMLPPDDEIARNLAYSMGYLALLTRSTPSVMATEVEKMGVMLNRLHDQMTGTLKTTADYHQKLDDRLTALPAEIAQGVNPAALAAQLVAGGAGAVPELRDSGGRETAEGARGEFPEAGGRPRSQAHGGAGKTVCLPIPCHLRAR